MRALGGLVAGWLALGVIVIAGFAAGPALLGLERVFEPGSYRATPLWIAVALAIGLVAACAGGWLAARIGRGRGAPLALAVLVLVGAILSELRLTPEGAPVARPPEQSVLEALAASREHAREPLVTRVTNPLAGLLGVALGAALALLRREERATRGPPGAAGTGAA